MRNYLFYLLCLCIPLTGFGQLLQENFEGSFPPTGWTITQNNPNKTWYQLSSVSGWDSGKAAGVDYDPSLTLQNEWLISPSFDLSDASEAVLSVAVGYSYFWAVSPNDNYDVYVKVSVDNGATWIKIWDGDDAEPFTPPFQLIPLSLPLTDFLGESNVKIAFQYLGSDGAGFYVDNILVEAEINTEPVEGSCELSAELADPTLGGPIWNRPLEDGSGLSSTGTGVSYHVYGPFTVSDSGTYIITSDQDDWDGFILIYQNVFDPESPLTNYVAGDDDGPGVDSQISTTLNSGTDYFLITTSFAPDDFGTFTNSITGPGTVTCESGSGSGEYCEPAINCTDDDVITNVTFAGIDNDSACSDNGYGDYTESVAPANVTAGGNYEISVTVGSGWFEKVSAWIDWNNDGVFDEEEFLGEIGDGGAGVTLTESISIPSVEEGTYRMRVHVNATGSDNPASDDPCINDLDNFGEYEDYLINVGEGSTGDDCGQGNESGGIFENAYQIGTGTDYENADDFYVSADNTLEIETIEMNIWSEEPIESIGFTFYNDEGGSPGNTVVESVSGLVPYELVWKGVAFDYNVYVAYIDVDLSFEGGPDGTTYWMQPMAVAAGGQVGGVFWEINSSGTLGGPIHTSEANGPWNPDEDNADGVFTLHCEHVDPPSEPCDFIITYDVEPITRVIFSDLDHSSDPTINGSPAVEDFTSMDVHVAAGESYDIALEGNTAGDYTTYFTVFIDWNHDGDLIDEGEMFEIGSITNSTGTDGQQATGSIMIPEDALEGAAWMRVVKVYGDSPLYPCGLYGFGQAEDYTLVVGDVPTADCSQEFAGEHNTGVGFVNNGTDVFIAANDINVEMNTQFKVETISLEVVTLGGAPTTFDVSFYTNNAGVDEQIGDTQTEITPSNITPNGTFGSTGFPVYTVELTLPVTQLLQATPTEDAKFWIAISGAPSVDANNVYWVSYLYTDNPDSEPSWQSPDGGASWAEFVNTNGEPVEGIMTVSGTCETLSISDINNYEFAYYPNPVKDVLNIIATKSIQTVSVYDLSGKLVYAQNTNNKNAQINIAHLAPGVYVVKTESAGDTKTFKIVKK